MNRNDRSIAVFTMLAHGVFHTYELSIPIFVVIWLDTFSTTAATLGLVVSVGYGLVGVGALPSGLLADRYGSRALIVLSVVGMGVGFSLFSLATSVYLIGVATVLWGIAASVYHPAGLSLISRGAEDRGAVFAYHGVGGNVGTAFGPLLAALLLVFFHWRYVVALLVVPVIVVAALGYTIRFDEDRATEDGSDAVEATADGGAEGADGPDDESESSDDAAATSGVTDLRSMIAETRLLFTAGFATVFVIVMLYGVYYRGLLTFLPDVIADLPGFDAMTLFGRTVEPAQYVYTGLLTVGILGQYAGGHVTDYVRTERALLTSLAALCALALLFLPASEAGVFPFLVVCGLLGFFLYATAPIYQVVIAEYAASDVHGLSYGYTYLGMFGVGAVGAALAGALLTHFTASALLTVLAGLALLAAGLVVALIRKL